MRVCSELLEEDPFFTIVNKLDTLYKSVVK